MASALGAKITVHTEESIQVKVNQPATSYLSYNDPRVLFGLGRGKSIRRIEIRWPDGTVEQFEGLKVNAYHSIAQGDGLK